MKCDIGHIALPSITENQKIHERTTYCHTEYKVNNKFYYIYTKIHNKKKERNRVDKYRSKYKKKRRGLHGYKSEKVTTTTTQSESMLMQDGEEPDLSLSSVGKTEKEFVLDDVENLKSINKIVPIAAVNSDSSQGPSISGVVSCKMKSFKKYHDKLATTRL